VEQIPVVQSQAIPAFCLAVVERHASTWPPSEDQLARDFIAHLGIAQLGSYPGLVKWCARVGIDVSMTELPDDLHRANFWRENNMSIVMPPDGGYLISREHTLLYEIRELLEGEFSHLKHPTDTGDALETRADQFAASVRIATSVELSKTLFQFAKDVRNPLRRACAYGLAGMVTLTLVINCVGVRRLETQVEAQKPGRAT
jgi:hypothetical protein